MSDSIVIVSAARTPMGGFMGDFASLAAHDLGGAAIQAAVQRAGIAPELVTEVIFGNCLMAGQGQAPARQAAFESGLARRCLALPCHQAVAKQHFGHQLGRDAGTLDRGLDGHATKIVGSKC